MPGSNATSQQSTLAALTAGSRGTITGIPFEDAALAVELAALRILPGEPVDVVEVIPFGGPLLVQTAGGVYALGRRLAGRITVATSARGRKA